MFSAADIASMRAMVATAFDQTCTILQQISTPNDGGSSTTSDIQVPNTPCHVRPNRRIPQEQSESGTLAALKRFEVILPWNASISVTDRIGVNSGGVTSVSVGANSAIQALASVAGIIPGGWLYFGTAQVVAQVVSISGLNVTLKVSEGYVPVNTATNEVVTLASMFEVLAHDAGKSYQTKIICDCMRVDDGSQ